MKRSLALMGALLLAACVESPVAPVVDDGALSPSFDLSGPTAWTILPSMPVPRAFASAAAGPDGRIYVMGGVTSYMPNSETARVDVFDPSTDSWSPGASMPARRKAHGAAMGGDGRIYVVGGAIYQRCGGGWFSWWRFCTTATVEAFDPATGTWASVAPMTRGRYLPFVTAGLDGRIYALGGNYDTTGEVYDPQTGVWSLIATMPVSRKLGAAATGSDGRIYVTGGYDYYTQSGGYWINRRTVDVYDPVSGLWSSAADLPVENGLHGLSMVGGADGDIYVLGGNQYNVAMHVALAYDPETDSWRDVGPMNHAHYRGAAAVAGDGRIIMAGGGSDQDPWVVADAEAYLGNTPPTVAIAAAAEVDEGSEATFTADAHDPDGDALTYHWTFDDGLTTGGAEAARTYPDDGAHSVTVTVTDGKGGEATSSITFTVLNVAPQVTLGAVAEILEGETASADGTFADPGADTWTAQADFGDGSTPALVNLVGNAFAVQHTYLEAGSYTLSVGVTDDDGGTGVGSAHVTVLTVFDLLGRLDDMIVSSGLPKGTANSLGSKLGNAVKSLEADRVGAALNQLNALANELDALVRSGRLDSGDRAVLGALLNRVVAYLQGS